MKTGASDIAVPSGSGGDPRMMEERDVKLIVTRKVTIGSRSLRGLIGLMVMVLGVIATAAQTWAQVGGQVQAQTNAQLQANKPEGGVSPASAPAQADPGDDGQEDGPSWGSMHRRVNTVSGASGGIRVVDPGTGSPGSIRTQVMLDAYSGSDFLIEGDSVEQDGQAISLGWSPTEYMELYAALLNRGTAISPQDRSLHVLGDVLVGVDVGFDLTPVFRLGGGLRFAVLNAVGSSDSLLDATGVGVRATAALDLMRLEKAIPLIARFNIDYLFDNSGSIIEDLEDSKLAALEDPARRGETRHLIDRFERFALGINRVDILTFGVGAEFPLELSTDMYLYPMAEWRLGLPVNRQDFNCPFFSSDEDRGTSESADDTCMDDGGLESYPMTATLGARVAFPVRGLSALLAVDLGLTGKDTFVRELIPTAPYRVLFGIGYDYDAKPQPPPVVIAAPEATPEPEPITGRLSGVVVSRGSGVPVAGAVIKFVDYPLTALATDPSGRFTTYAFPPGAISMNVSHPDFEAGQCSGTIADQGGEASIRCELTPQPQTGTLTGELVDGWGIPVAGASLQLVGPATAAARTDSSGHFEQADLPAGKYDVKIDLPGYALRTATAVVSPRSIEHVTLSVPALPKGAVTPGNGELSIVGLEFEADSTRVSQASEGAVAALADYLVRQPTLRIEIAAPPTRKPGLASERALTLRQRLVRAGVAESRVVVASEPARSLTVRIVP